MLSSNTSAVSGDANYIEDVFSTYLYTGNGSTQSIVNGIDLSTQGGMTWLKARDVSASNYLFDTARGRAYSIRSDSTAGQATSGSTNDLTSFNTNGFSLGVSSQTYTNVNASTFASWTFRKQPKFFDIVTYTGDGTNGRAISHSLGSVPGCILVKCTSASQAWRVYHRSLPTDYNLELNATDGAFSDGNVTSPTSTTFTVNNYGSANTNGNTYVAYLFAHNAGGFGLTGTDNVISCGSVTLDGSGNASVNLGYEPQWVMIKRADNTSNWYMHDTMRGLDLTTYTRLYANTSGAELTSTPTYIAPSSTGFNLINGFNVSGANWIYIAIRRGPMKVPTSGTSVFAPVERAGTGTTTAITGLGFTPDIVIAKATNKVRENVWFDRLRGAGQVLSSVNTSAENADANALISFDMNGVTVGADTTYYSGINNNNTGQRYANWFMKRAPSFFDEVCYTGTGVSIVQNVSHNLSVVPTLMIVKGTNATSASQWRVYDVFDGADNYMALNTTAATASGYGAYWGNSTTPTSSVFSVSSSNNQSGGTYVAYLFATCAGVSKVFSFTGNGSTQTINCGFAGGARFVLLKATSTTGGWYVYDTARGMTTLTDPYLFLNSTAAESATLGSVTTVTTGFAVNESVLAGVNTNGVSYIGLAIA